MKTLIQQGLPNLRTDAWNDHLPIFALLFRDFLLLGFSLAVLLRVL
ncbi:MAG TPA: hypothetical protein VE954_26510 [Oligoflexus sp.]|nr:hypothetical protein [Oligoflexus sp.]HYX36678.1 hypothetical protein [Oligoflexus sp.]